MEYTEEEKEAIEEINNFIFEVKIFGITSNDSLFVKYSEFLLKLVEKQQKEIENQKNIIKEKAIVINNQELDKAKIHNNWQKELKENYVPKEAIREKIKQYESLPNVAIFQSKEPIIRVLKELLGE